jgi:hypothetical protein
MSHRMSKNYPEDATSKHATVRLPKDLLSAIEEFLQTDTAKKMGFLHRTDVTTEAIREFLKNQGYYPMPSRLEVINHDENGVKIFDLQLRRTADIYIKPKGIWCGLCQKDTCEHIKYALSLKDVQQIIKKRKNEGWKLPDI